MTDIAARQVPITGTTSQWSANDRVLRSGEFGVEVTVGGDRKVKIGNGTGKWSELSYFAPDSSGINTATQAALDAKLALAGGTMTGPLILDDDASDDLGAVTLQQLEAEVDTLTTSISGKLATSGGSLSGYLTLHADPSSSGHAATKAYVDAGDALKVAKSGDTMTGQLTLPGSPSDAKHAVPKEYVDSGAWATNVGGSGTYSGKGVRLNSSGLIDPSMLPVNGAYLGTVDLTAAYALSGSFSNGSYYALTDSGTIDSSWATHLNGSPTDCYAGQLLIYRFSTSKWDLVGDTTDAAAIAGKLDKAGGTMTGPLILDDDATDDLGAVTLQQLEAAAALALQAANNLSDLANAATARGNLGGSTIGQTIFTAANAAAVLSAIGAAASGANTDITSVYLNNTGLKVKDTNASHGLIFKPGSDITADRTFTVTTGDSDRTLTMSGNATVSQDYSTSGYPNFNGIKENVYTITDGAAFEINPANGGLQIITLGASRTPKGTSFAAGSSVTLHIDDGSSYTITWTDSTFGTGGVKWVGGTAPTLAASGYTIVVLWKIGSQVYGMSPGSVA